MTPVSLFGEQEGDNTAGKTKNAMLPTLGDLISSLSPISFNNLTDVDLAKQGGIRENRVIDAESINNGLFGDLDNFGKLLSGSLDQTSALSTLIQSSESISAQVSSVASGIGGFVDDALAGVGGVVGDIVGGSMDLVSSATNSQAG